MPDPGPEVTIRDMTAASEIFVLDEFRLHAVDTDGAAARIVAAGSSDGRDPVPLLTSIDDPRDVATLREVDDGAPSGDGPRADIALRQLVATWQPAKRYRPRLSQRSHDANTSSFRLAVTESGINDEHVAPPGTWVGETASGEPVSRLLIGIPEGTHAGLLVLVGRDDIGSSAGGRGRAAWPLPLSRDLGVRIYESTRERAAPRQGGT